LDGIFYCGENFSAVRCAHPSYESEIRKHFSLDSGVFIDVGANIGKYSIMVGKRLGDKVKVIAFEPMPYTFEILKKNIELNKLKNIIPFEYALGKKEERLDFYLDREGVGGGAHSLIKDNANITKNKIGVCVKKLDDILKELKIKRVDLIKIDVEGAEADVLKGTEKTLKKYHPKIIFEAWNKEYLEKCKKILDKFGYKIKQIAPENYIAI
ncbi:FkbM family methyltransferase, partial [Candidatus Pacearchaeota archaeon]|nr:FkbM family methyltransferase [Candidatus Pacearchaeota archaeon]